MINNYSDEEIKKAIELYKKGYSSPKIAKELGRSDTGVRLALNKLGYVFTRQMGENIKPVKTLVEVERVVFKSKPVVCEGKTYHDITYAPNQNGIGQVFGCEVTGGAWFEWHERRRVKAWV